MNNFLDFERKNEDEPLEFELTFGREGHEPITLDMGGFSADFSGKIDRLDKTTDGFAIIDYKTSSDYGYRSGVLDGGKRIQPFIYAELYRVREGLGEDAVIRAGFLTLKNKSTLIVNPYNEEIRASLEEIFAYMRGVLEQGYFFETADCQYCDFTGVCSSYCGYHVEKKLENGNELVKKYRHISELE